MKKKNNLDDLFGFLDNSPKKNNKRKSKVSTENSLSRAISTAKNIENKANKASRVAKKIAPAGKKKVGFVVKIAVIAFCFVALLGSIPFSRQIEKSVNHADYTFLTTQGDYSVHFIDVGQGDSTLIELPDNKIFLIDAGPKSAKNNLLKYLDALNITTIDYLCFTHYDADHIGNGVEIFDELDVKSVFIPKVYSSYEVEKGLNTQNDFRIVTSNLWNNVSKAIYNEKCEINYNFDGVEILNETYGYAINFCMPKQNYESTANDYSPFIFVNLQNTKFLFTGDASSTQEKEFLASVESGTESVYDVDVFQLGHHGSYLSNCEEFLAVIKPEIAIASCSATNSYGHPSTQTLERLNNIGCEVKCTDEQGSIVLSKSTTTGKIEETSNFNYITDFYLEWKYVVLTGIVLVVMVSVPILKKKKKM